MQTVKRYDAMAKSLHWSIAILILCNLCLGLILRNHFYNSVHKVFITIHKENGLLIFVLVIFRIFWRSTHKYPTLKQMMPWQEKILANFGQISLYLLMLAVPISGVLLLNSKGGTPSLFGYQLPHLIPIQDGINVKKYLDLHTFLVIILMTLVCGHIIAALKHHFIDKNKILLRMLPRFRK